MFILAVIRLSISYLVLLLVASGAIIALCHVSRQRAEAFLITHKLSKGMWMGILAVCALISLLMLCFMQQSFSISTNPLYFASLMGTAVMVYWVDVKPAVNDIQKP